MNEQPYPSSSPQNMLEVIDTLIGVLVFATIIGGVGSVVTQMNQEIYDFREKMDAIKFYMKYRIVSPDIQERVLSCFMYMYSQHQLTDEKELVDVLPPRLQGQIAVNLHMETLKKVELFKQCEPGFLYEVVLRMKQQVYSPNDYLFRVGERAKVRIFVAIKILFKFNWKIMKFYVSYEEV
uniref:Cyclic nucleotide-binding domain-containing protein n=1 Tax=Heterorhabditis bacteriophora TaxID=37862 RepID=A0A1I7WUX9_HETBA